MYKKQPIVGKIYATQCGYCQMLKPEWDKMKSNIGNKTNQLQIVEIEANETAKMEDFKRKYPKLQVNGYPTIFKIHTNNHIEYYSGERTAPAMQKWALQKNAKKQTFRRKGGIKKTVKRRKLFGLF